jgi:glucan 1,3-beta-glucosidase
MGLSALSTNGTQWVNAEGEQVLLKGTNLGNWLISEFWMMNQTANTVTIDQCTLEATLDERFGFDERERLLDIYRDNWISDRDWDVMEAYGLNVIRLPFIWNLIEDENNPRTLRDDAWQYIDYAIEEAEERGMYIILDLHGAVGAQGFEHHSGCANQNLYWSTPEFQERTLWLWEQIATRYQNNGTVAAYGLLNEPWGTTPENLADEMIELYQNLRNTDSEKIIILPGHSAGIDAYGSPSDFNGHNVAFEMHFYPGIFGWGETNYETHRDWLTCGETGTSGMCEWEARLATLASPFLIGEFQPWANLGYEFGGDNARATYDRFAQAGWAATNWAYKVLTANGGHGAGTWGMVTNQESALGLVGGSTTWTCAGWDSALSDGCAASAGSFTPDVDGSQTYYFVVKAGACCEGTLDVSVDSLSLRDEDGNELIVNGDFGSSEGWNTWTAAGAVNINFNMIDTNKLPSDATGAVLNISGQTNTIMPDINGGVYQAVILEEGKTYTISGVHKDNGSTNSWNEIYLVADEPMEGVDVVAEPAVPVVDFVTAPMADIETLFTLFGTIQYDIHQPLMEAMTSTTPSTLYSLPATPQGLSVTETETGIQLTWTANTEDDLIGYRVYRSVNSESAFRVIAMNIATNSFTDTDVESGQRYFYQVAALDNKDISYASEVVSIGENIVQLPALIQAENWTSMSGFEVESTSDTGGGSNTGFADAGDWLEYDVLVPNTGTYTIEYRLASETGSSGFTVSVDSDVVDTVAVPATGGWQSWSTVTKVVTLPAGRQTIRLDSVGGSWNMNWFRVNAPE